MSGRHAETSARQTALGLMFHRFHSDGARPRGQGSLSASRLNAILDSLDGSCVLEPTEWVARAREGTLRPEHRCLTLDDGLTSQYEVALPVIEARGFRAFWFVYSSVFEGDVNLGEVMSQLSTAYFDSQESYVTGFKRHCTSDELDGLRGEAWHAYRDRMRALAPFYSLADLEFRYLRNAVLSPDRLREVVSRLCVDAGVDLPGVAASVWMDDDRLAEVARRHHAVGLHSYSHPFDIAKLSAAAQAGEYAKNAAHLTRATGRRPDSMSHPLGVYNGDTLDVLRGMGIACGFRSNAAVPDGADRLSPSPLELARVDSADL